MGTRVDRHPAHPQICFARPLHSRRLKLGCTCSKQIHVNSPGHGDSPGHGAELQDLFSCGKDGNRDLEHPYEPLDHFLTSEPNTGQSVSSVVMLLHTLSLLTIPPPQVREHEDHSPHSPQSPERMSVSWNFTLCGSMFAKNKVQSLETL